MFIKDENFGEIVDFDLLRSQMRSVYDNAYPEYNLLGAMQEGSRLFNDEPNYMIAGGASFLAYTMLVAAGEFELAESLKDNIFTLGWTEEHCGTDLLSIRTQATPLSDDPDEKQFHIKGSKWIINNSYHADYHMVLAKVDPEQDGPRSLSVFLVPRSSVVKWERLRTHVLPQMVLTTFDIDGPGQLVGKKGHGLSIVQQMAMPSKYQATYVGARMLKESITESIEHLSSKRIFGDNPIHFSNVIRQMYNIALQGALVSFTYYRAVALSDSSFLQFYGTMLKSWMLLRANQILSQNLLVAGSKGFVRESTIGRNAIDSFVLPVFDGHYTLNTLMTAKQARHYLSAEKKIDAQERIETLRNRIFLSIPGNQIYAQPKDIRRPEFFDLVDYTKQLQAPVTIEMEIVVNSTLALLDYLEKENLIADAEYKYKVGTLLHWIESILAAYDLWYLSGNDSYLNAIIQQYNGFVIHYNNVISEGDLEIEFLEFAKQLPLPDSISEDPRGFLLDLINIENIVENKLKV